MSKTNKLYKTNTIAQTGWHGRRGRGAARWKIMHVVRSFTFIFVCMSTSSCAMERKGPADATVRHVWNTMRTNWPHPRERKNVSLLLLIWREKNITRGIPCKHHSIRVHRVRLSLFVRVILIFVFCLWHVYLLVAIAKQPNQREIAKQTQKKKPLLEEWRAQSASEPFNSRLMNWCKSSIWLNKL